MMEPRPTFQHPPWMLGIMLILGLLSLVVGLTLDPFWLVMGSPAILTLLVFVGVRIVLFRRTLATPPGIDSGDPPDGPGPPRPDMSGTDG